MFKYFQNFIIKSKTFPQINRRKMNLSPPDRVRGLKTLDKELFKKQITVPALQIPEADLHKTLAKVKKFLLKMEKLKPVQSSGDKKTILLLPGSENEEALSDVSGELKNVEVELGYDNWKANEVLKAVLPVEDEQLTSFSRVGHILHLNLREHLVDYKGLIAEVLRDKTVGIRTVVNKTHTIENTYRNFSLETLIGEPDFQVEVKENGVLFEFDFSTVYWNPRLAREHERIVKETLKPGMILYDCFAGVGPFAVPSGKRGIRVLANDLNPESFRWLQHNIKKNKVQGSVTASNKDAKDFILEDIKEDLLANVTDDNEIHITMNLPAMATTFLNSFRGLLKSSKKLKKDPVVHVYCFAPCENNEKEAIKLAEDGLQAEIKSLLSVNFVRSVAPNKDMMRVDFALTPEILNFDDSCGSSPPPKRCKTENNGKTFKEEAGSKDL